MGQLLSILNPAGQDFGAITFADALTSPWVHLLANTPQSISIPAGAFFVRFAYDQGAGNVYCSPDSITIPSGGNTEFSRAETNPLVRAIGPLIEEGITTLTLVADANTTVHLYFYPR